MMLNHHRQLTSKSHLIVVSEGNFKEDEPGEDPRQTPRLRDPKLGPLRMRDVG